MNTAMSKMTLKSEDVTRVVLTRHFNAPPEAADRAHIDPKLVQQWMLGPERWTMPFAKTTRDPAARSATSGAMAKQDSISPVKISNCRIAHVRRMHLVDPTPDNPIETRFAPDGTGTLMTMPMTLPDAQTRAAMLATGMEHGREASDVRLERMI